jgi:hypothetical protein
LATPGYVAGKALAQVTPDRSDEQVVRLAMLWTNAAVTATTAVVLALLCELLGASRRGALLLALAFGLGSQAWPAAKTLFSEPSTALCTVLAVLCAVRAVRDADRRWAAWCGLAFGAAVLCRASAAMFVVPLAAYLAWSARGDRVRRREQLVAFVVGGAGPLVAFLVTNWLRFGSPFDAGYEKVSQQGSLWQGLVGQLFSPGKSVFLYAPILVVAVAGAIRGWRVQRPETALLLGVVGLNLVFFARAPFWNGDNAWGCRYFGIVLPVGVALAAPIVDALRWRRVAGVATVFGIVLPGLLGTLIFFNTGLANVNSHVGREPVGWAGGQAKFLVESWWNPRWQPIAGHASLVPMAARETFDARRDSDPVRPPFPPTMNARFNWYDWPPRLDLWPFWLAPTDMPGWLALLVIPLLIGAAGAGRALRRLV